MPKEAPDSTLVAKERRQASAMAAIFALVAILAAIDLVADVVEGTTLVHAALEGAMVLFGLWGLFLMGKRSVMLAREHRQFQRERAGLQERLLATQKEAARWRSEAHEYLRGLGTSIDEQLTRWDLTPAEKEVALLLLKGLSLKEIAEARDVSEATVRQQAGGVYHKAGLEGRAELSAFFLEDLLLPDAPTPE